jgi:hypothetical protein
MSIVGFGTKPSINLTFPLYWSNADAKPVELQIIDREIVSYDLIIASDINNLGQIVGFYGNFTDQFENDFIIPIIWSTPNSNPTTLPLLDGYTIHFAKGINNLGQIVGIITGKNDFLPVIWDTPNDKPTKLQLLEGYIGGLATGINDLGQIIGYILKEDGSYTGVIWTNANARPTKLASLPLPAVDDFTIYLFNTGINNIGQIVTYTENKEIVLPVFLSSTNAAPTPLQLLNDNKLGSASGINNLGQIVGAFGSNSNSTSIPVIWDNANSKPSALQLPDGYVGGFALGISGPSISPTPISNICFPAGTPVQTDQGLIHIDDIDPQIHTINNQPILHITKTTTLDNYLISFDKNSLAKNIPSRKTLMTKDHKIMFEGNLVPAYRFLDYSDKVKKVKYSGETLYNILLAEYGTINVNNLMCETLHPDNIIAKLYMRELEEQPRLICQLNSSLEKKDFASYTDVVHRLTHNL